MLWNIGSKNSGMKLWERDRKSKSKNATVENTLKTKYKAEDIIALYVIDFELFGSACDYQALWCFVRI